MLTAPQASAPTPLTLHLFPHTSINLYHTQHPQANKARWPHLLFKDIPAVHEADHNAKVCRPLKGTPIHTQHPFQSCTVLQGRALIKCLPLVLHSRHKADVCRPLSGKGGGACCVRFLLVLPPVVINTPAPTPAAVMLHFAVFVPTTKLPYQSINPSIHSNNRLAVFHSCGPCVTRHNRAGFCGI